MTRTALLHLVNEFADISTNRQLLNLIRNLDAAKYANHVGCVKDLEGPLAAQFQQAGAEVVNFGRVAGFPGLGRAGRIARYVRARGIQVVHTHALRADLIGGLAVRLMRRRPVLFSTKCNSSYVPGQRGWLARNLIYWPVIYLPDQVITVSKAMREHILSFLRLDPRRVVAVQTGIVLDDFYRPAAREGSRAALGVALDEFVIGYAGRLVSGKGLDDLLHAFQRVVARHEKSRLLVVGEGPLKVRLQALALELGIPSHVIFPGFRQDIPELLAMTDVFVLPSLTEGLPQSVMEAMAAGKAVVATPVGGIGELLEPHVTGLITPPRDPAALAEAFFWLLDHAPQREELGRKARAYALAHFSLPQMASAYDQLYRQQLERQTR